MLGAAPGWRGAKSPLKVCSALGLLGCGMSVPAREPPPTAPLEAILEPAAQEELRREIAAASGGEVFFFGRLGPGGAVAEVEVIARGNKTQVPALLDRAGGFDVAIHNHPSGNLLPSDADLCVAHELAAEGLGFLIVDDAVQRLHEVIPARRAKRPRPVTAEEIDAFLGPEGPLAATLHDAYEPRPSQERMARQVAVTLSLEGGALLEAGTGTGKTFAYLVPGALFALRNQEKVVVSTATKNLQGQIVRKDVPALRQSLGPAGEELEVVVVKGRGNYVSLRRAAEAAAGDAQIFSDDDELKEVRRLAAWAAVSTTGDRAELMPPAVEAAWEQVTSSSDDCLGPKCPRFQDCHYFNARRAASKAHVLVVNHHLLFADLAIKQSVGFDRAAVLPPYRRVVLDEGHHIEAIASEHFGLSLTQTGLTRPLARLKNKRRRKRGLLPSLQRAFIRHGSEHSSRMARQLEERIEPLRRQTYDTLELSLAEVAIAIRTATGEFSAREARLRLGPEHEALLEPLADGQKALKILATRLTRLVQEARSILEELGPVEALLRQLDSVCKQLSRGATGLGQFMKAGAPLPEEAEDGPAAPGPARGAAREAPEFVRWAEVWRTPRGGERLRLRLAPLDVGPQLVDALFRPAKSVVVTSATLTVQGRTEYLEQSLGLAGAESPPFASLHRDVIPSPFSYSRQAVLAVPDDIPLPTEPGFEAAVSEAMAQLVDLSQGRAFLLFTSYGQLGRTYDTIEERLRDMGLTPLRQGSESRTSLLERFRSISGAVLFGTSSFWEGVDVPGDALVLVCIAKLPFSVPTEPLWQARAEAIERRGGSAFQELQLPRAILKLTQGFGRLIRTQHDRGAVVVLDKRIVTRRYGRAFFDSLPDVRVEVAPLIDLLPTLRRYVV
jgi:ATP-dependent DNA helicase DinG